MARRYLILHRSSLCTFLVLAALLGGCSAVKGALLFGPTPGMEPVAPGVYAEPAMPSAARTELLAKIAAAREQTRAFFGSLLSSPEIYACATEECFQTFGGGSARAKAFGRSKILLSPRGITIPIVSHEWSHAELHARLGIVRMRQVPLWFDEGLAVVVSREPSHSEEVWRQIVARKIPHPNRFELVSAGDWRLAVKMYGDVERSLGDPEKLSVVYATAGQEVRVWHGQRGREGLLILIESLARGEKFASAYERIGTQAAMQ